jgi:hypothetical protein
MWERWLTTWLMKGQASCVGAWATQTWLHCWLGQCTGVCARAGAVLAVGVYASSRLLLGTIGKHCCLNWLLHRYVRLSISREHTQQSLAACMLF